jgi:hypothetical protein
VKTSYKVAMATGAFHDKRARKRGLSWWRHEQQRQDALLASLVPAPGSLASILGNKQRKAGK